MATPQEMKAADRKSVAAQTASMLSLMTTTGTRALSGANIAMLSSTVVEPPTLAEAFPFVTIPLRTVIEPPENLGALLEPAGAWLHLVRNGPKSSYFSVSDAEHRVLALTTGDLPQKIFDAVKWLDANDGDENHDPICMMSFPALYVYALGIRRERGPYAVVVSAPQKLKVLKAGKFEEVPLGNLLKLLKKNGLKANFIKAADDGAAVYG